ncbi:MAG TPA: TM2 domain-containing protein [Pyrinomonadaceae bacterium]|nr:TM2 domain-containing protein [Pyrinomonadaceae bacterium]
MCGSPASITDQNCPSCQHPLAQPAPAPRRVERLPERLPERTPAAPPPQVAPTPPRTRNLAPCPDCGRMVSTAAFACPSCGRPFTHPAPPAPVVYHAPNAFLAPVYQPVFIQPTKSRALFIVLALFFGCLGVHNFYAGHTGRGAAQLAITLLTGCAGGFFLTGLWAFIECLVVDTDSMGRPMT